MQNLRFQVLAGFLLSLSTSLFAGSAHAEIESGFYRTLDGYFFEVNKGSVCLYRTTVDYEQDVNSPAIRDTDIIEYQELVELEFLGYCGAVIGPAYPTRIKKLIQDQELFRSKKAMSDRLEQATQKMKLENSSSYCRYFVATDRLIPLTNSNEFTDLTLWLVDENKRKAVGDLLHWDDFYRVASDLQSDPITPRTTLSVTSDWLEISPRDGEAPLFSLYVFRRWKSYKLSQLKATDVDPTAFTNYRPVQILPGFKGRQEVSKRTATRKYFALEFQVLRLCSRDNDDLFPKKRWVLPARQN